MTIFASDPQGLLKWRAVLLSHAPPVKMLSTQKRDDYKTSENTGGARHSLYVVYLVAYVIEYYAIPCILGL